ncbi:MAG: 4-amino-4-deoxy-L-arabinose transferase [Deltaproteobacteria bacterium]|nr:MAG: 4-amino-4-deoxy-L-arabinose transferase [Deltaproteobacteria bacterium]
MQQKKQKMALILTCVIFSVAGQLLLKWGVSKIDSFRVRSSLLFFIKAFTNPLVILALVLYGFSFSLWLIVLSRERLGFAYLFFGLTYIFIPLASWRFLGEELTLSQILGMILIAAGVIIVGAGR